MGHLKNTLLQKLETDPQFAEHYWQDQDDGYQEPELPIDINNNINPSNLTLIKPSHWSINPLDEIPPF
jgi:hypothetical protein